MKSASLFTTICGVNDASRHKYTFFAILSAFLLAAGCDDDSSSGGKCGENEIDNNGTCICDVAKNYYGTADSCLLCKGEHKIVKDNQCVCDSDYEDDGNGGCNASSDVCKNVTCGDHGTCKDDGGTAVCNCETGYHVDPADAKKCVSDTPQSDVCKDVDCGGHGTCKDDEGTAVCDCETGYHVDPADSANCISDTPQSEICKDVDCGGHGTCKDDGGTAVCDCETGYRVDPNNLGNCVADASAVDVCEHVSCDGHGTCKANEDEAVCECETGYELDKNDKTHCISICEGITCGDHGYCYGETGTPVCDCMQGYVADPQNALNCVADTTDPCKDKTCDGHGTCVPAGKSNYYCICDPGYLPATKLTTCWEDPADSNGNGMKDLHETAPDQGTDCRDKSVRNKCSDFCDSFIGYKCSTKCKSDDQCNDSSLFCRSDGRCVPKVFKTNWYVSQPNSEIKFPAGKGQGCHYTIDWGDGSEPEQFTECDKPYRTHTYKDIGHILISVTGEIYDWACLIDIKAEPPQHVCGRENPVYLRSVFSFGPISLGHGAFYGADALNDFKNVDIPNPRSMSMNRMFYNAVWFNQPINHWDTSNVYVLDSTFYHAEKFNQPLNDWDTSNVTNMESMFYYAKSFNQPLNGWNTAKAELMYEMFYRAEKFNQPLNDWDTSNVKDMDRMFACAEKFNQPLNSWNTANVRDMSYMFSGSKSFNQPLNSWNTANVTNMEYMFKDAKAFNQSLEKWDVTEIKKHYSRYHYMFSGSGLSSDNWNKMVTENEGWASMSKQDLGIDY
ncbi:MAG: DUF285 domain-containing protein [Proteobacteria bacterium]|nr:DUF285 domain-containing protein [Pseudomonadota bacterium]